MINHPNRFLQSLADLYEVQSEFLYKWDRLETSLDHDLDDSAIAEYYANAKPNNILNYDNILEKTGMDCCKFLVQESMDTNIPLPQVHVHSSNPPGRENMMGLINNYLKSCGLLETCEKKIVKFSV